jgi:hypothetical protein
MMRMALSKFQKVLKYLRRSTTNFIRTKKKELCGFGGYTNNKKEGYWGTIWVWERQFRLYLSLLE